ncbi:transporter associated domain-containing protein [Salicibibacter halophilus]
MYVPQVGEVLKYEHLTFEILDADTKKIRTVKITKEGDEK